MQSVLCWIWPYLAGALVGWLLAGWLARKALAQRPATVERLVDRPVDRVLEKLIEKTVDNPQHLKQITELTAAAALLPLLRNQLSALQAAPPKVVETFIEIPVDRVVEKFVEKIVDRPVDRIVEITVEKLIVDTAGIEARDRELADWRARYAELETRLQRETAEAAETDRGLAMARAAGFKLKGADDLQVIEGIGPKIEELLHAAGVRRFSQLAQMTAAQIQPILNAAGPRYKLAVPATWPEQAALAAGNQWQALKALQDVLSAGLRK